MGAQEASAPHPPRLRRSRSSPGQLSVLLPGPFDGPAAVRRSRALIVLAIVVAGALPSVRASGPAQLWLALAYVGVIVAAAAGGRGPDGGFAPLVILPAMWLALFGSRRQLLIDARP